MLFFLISGSFFIILAGIYMMMQVFQLIKLDAQCRGIKHPTFWAWLGSVGQKGEGLILYFLKRKDFPRGSMSDEDFIAFQSYKRRALVALIIQLLGAGIVFSALIFQVV